MSISDELMWRYVSLLSLRGKAELETWKRAVAEGANPRDYKVLFAQEMVTRFHSARAADLAYKDFVQRFREHALPDSMPELTIPEPTGAITVASLLKRAGLTASTSEAIEWSHKAPCVSTARKLKMRCARCSPAARMFFRWESDALQRSPSFSHDSPAARRYCPISKKWPMREHKWFLLKVYGVK